MSQTEILSATRLSVVLNTQDGPVEYVPAAPAGNGTCDGCAFQGKAWRRVCAQAPCAPWESSDGSDIIWIEK